MSYGHRRMAWGDPLRHRFPTSFSRAPAEHSPTTWSSGAESSRLVTAPSTSQRADPAHTSSSTSQGAQWGTEWGHAERLRPQQLTQPNALLGAGAARPTSKHTGKAHAWLPKIPAPCAMGSEAKRTSALPRELCEHPGTQK